MFGNGDGQLRAFFEQLPLGVTVEDYSPVKRRLDQLRADGIRDIESYLKDNPQERDNMIRSIRVTDVNASMLRTYKVDSVQEYIDLYDDENVWRNDEWIDSYTQILVNMSPGSPYFSEFRDVTATGEAIYLGYMSWILEGHEDDWSVVISTHEDISARKRAEANTLTSERRFRALFHQSPLGITVQDYSEAKRQINHLRAQGIDDIYAHLRDNEEVFLACVRGISLVDANDTQIRMFGTASLEEYREHDDTSGSLNSEQWRESYLQELAAFANGDVTYSIDVSDYRADDTPIDVRMISRISDNTLNDWTEVISTHEDITDRKRAEADMQTSERRFRALFHQSPLGITVQDYSGAKRQIDRLRAQGIDDIHGHLLEHDADFLACMAGIRLIDANDTQVRMFGAASLDQYIAWEDPSNLADDDMWRGAYVRELLAYANGHDTYSEEVADTLPDGRYVEIRMTSRISDDALHDWSEVVSTHEDITDRKRAESHMQTSERRFRALFHQSPLGITVQDHSGAKRQIDRLRAQGVEDMETHLRENKADLRACIGGIRLTEANDTQVRMFGIETLEEYRDWEDTSALMDDEEWLESYVQELATFASGEDTYATEVTDTMLDETPIDIRMISRISDNALDDWSEVVSTHEDITDRKKLDRMKSEFVSTVSHELRTPLTSIKGSLGLVTEGALGELPETAADMVRVAYSNTNRLISLVNDVLDIEKIAAGAIVYEFAPLDLSALVSGSIADNEGFLASHGDRHIVTNVDEAVMVNGDSKRLLQVVANLLSNAIKFSPDGGEINVSVSARDSHVTVSFRDHGEGIPEAFRDRIFQRFAQADGTDTRQTGGTGLGLSISKSIIEAHGGIIDFETESGAGSRFFFTLPALI